MADIGQRQGVIALAHPGDGGGDVERGPVRHRGLEADQRFRLVVADHVELPAAADAAVIISQDGAAALRQIAGKSAVDPARRGGRGIDQDGLTLDATGQEQRRREWISVRCRDDDIVRERLVLSSFAHRQHPKVSRLDVPPIWPSCTARAAESIREGRIGGAGLRFYLNKCEFGFARKELSRGERI